MTLVKEAAISAWLWIYIKYNIPHHLLLHSWESNLQRSDNFSLHHQASITLLAAPLTFCGLGLTALSARSRAQLTEAEPHQNRGAQIQGSILVKIPPPNLLLCSCRYLACPPRWDLICSVLTCCMDTAVLPLPLPPVSSSRGSSTAQHSPDTEGAEQGLSQRLMPPPLQPAEVAFPIPWTPTTSCWPPLRTRVMGTGPLCFSHLLFRLVVADQLSAGRKRQMCP